MIYDKAISSITDLISEFITDDDLKNKLDFETEKLKFELDKALLESKTTPKIDAMVKLMIAMRDIIIPLFRPMIATLMPLFGAYCVAEGIELSETMQVALFGSPIMYGASRHSDKKEKEKTKRVKIKTNSTDYDPDFDD